MGIMVVVYIGMIIQMMLQMGVKFEALFAQFEVARPKSNLL